MKSILFSILLATAFVALGCNDKTTPKPQASDGAPKAEEHKGEAGNILRLEHEMLRDLKITTAAVQVRPAGEGSMLLGELRVNENAYAEVGAPVSSRIIALHADPGKSVTVGEPLATLQSSELGKARSDLITAKAHLELANQVLARKQRLASERISPQREVQEAEANASSAEAEVRAARASLRALGVSAEETSDTSQYQLRSPVSGVVIDRSAVRGQMVGPDVKLFKVGDLSTLWLTVQAFERDAVRIRPGAEVRISFAALPGRSFTGKVDLIGREVNHESRTVPVRILIANKEGVLRPGMSATAWVAPTSSSETSVQVMTVPVDSLQRVVDDWVVFLPTGHTGDFEIRRVGRGRDLGGEIEILNGLKAGESIVVDGAFLLKAEAEKARGGAEHDEH